MVNQSKVGVAAAAGHMFKGAGRYLKARRARRRLQVRRLTCEQEAANGYTQLAQAAIEANLGTDLPGGWLKPVRRTSIACRPAPRAKRILTKRRRNWTVRPRSTRP